MKKCIKCGAEKNIEDFYKHKEMSDGYLNKCKDCTKKDTLKYRKENIEKVRHYDRNRPNKKERVLKNIERILNNEDKYKRYLEKKKEWSKKNKIKRQAHNKVARALLKGIIKRKFNCEICGCEENLEAHHNDYNKPLEVIWLCKKCHTNTHIVERKKERGEY